MKKKNSVMMDETDYRDVLSGKCGCYAQKELVKILIECVVKDKPFYVTDEGKIVKRIV